MYIGRAAEFKPFVPSEFNGYRVATIANDLLKRIDDPRRRAVLMNMRDHAMAEACGDYEALMATLSTKEQRYVFHTPDGEMVPATNYDEIGVYYKTMIDANAYLLDFDVEKLIVGLDALCLEGVERQIFPGSFINMMPGLSGYEDAEAYQVLINICVFFIFDENALSIGEQAYNTAITPKTIFHIPSSDLPKQYSDGPVKFADKIKEMPGWVVG